MAVHGLYEVATKYTIFENGQATPKNGETLVLLLCFKQAGTLNVILVANGKTERDSELPASRFKLDC